MGVSTQSTWGSIRTIITQQPSSLGYVITQYLHKPTLQSTTGSITLQLPTMLFATIITHALLFASSSLAQMSMPGMSTSMDTAMSMPNAMSSRMTMTTTASSAKSSLMASATSTSSSSSATVSTNAAPGSTGPSEAMIAAIGLVTWVALGVSNVF